MIKFLPKDVIKQLDVYAFFSMLSIHTINSRIKHFALGKVLEDLSTLDSLSLFKISRTFGENVKMGKE